MFFKVPIYLFIVSTFIGCYSIKHIDESKILSKDEVAVDVSFLKRELTSKHFDLDWEGRELEILAALDSISVHSSNIKTQALFRSLKTVVNSIDDGHTQIFGVTKEDVKRMQGNRQGDNFSCILVDTQTVLLRIPNFRDKARMSESLRSFRSMIHQPGIDRLIIDFRNNKGGHVHVVVQFLRHVLNHDFQICSNLHYKPQRGVREALYNLKYMTKGYKKTNDLLVKTCKGVQGRNLITVKHKYLLVDSTIISGSMLATYHLRKANYIVIGSNPPSLFNTFSNPRLISLPNSNLYVGISTGRLTLDNNYRNRNADMLSCDIPFTGNSLYEVLHLIRQYEN